MKKKGALELSVSFIVILIICIVVFSFGVYILKKFFTHAETIKMVYDERTEKEIERLLDDGSRIAVPFDKKTIRNGESKTFGIGVLNVLNTGPSNEFKINISFNKAYDKKNELICSMEPSDKPPFLCGNPGKWLQTTAKTGDLIGVAFEKTINNNEQEKFLLGVSVKEAPSGTYIYDLDVKYKEGLVWKDYDPMHKLYVEVP